MKQAAIITGGSRGIGYAIARQLGKDGYGIVIMAVRPQEMCEKQLKELTEEEIPWIYVQGDVRVEADRELVIKKAVERFNGIDVLVNNAGVAPEVRTDLLEMTEESYDHVMDINTKATMFLTQSVAKQMMKQEQNGKKKGTIVNVSSCSATVSSIGRGEYCISKAGMSMLTKLYADRLAPEGIYVYEVRPGIIQTDMTDGVKEKYDKMLAQGVFPIARWGTPEDVASVVSAFCGEQFCYTTGNYIDVDGGFHIQRL